MSPQDRYPAAAVIAAAVLAACGYAVRRLDRRIGALLVAIGVAAGLGGTAAGRLVLERRSWFVGVASVRQVEGVVAEDARWSDDGSTIFRLLLESVAGPAGRGSARGRVVVRDPAGRRVLAGERVAATGRVETWEGSLWLSAERLDRRGYANPLAEARALGRGAVEAASDSLGYPASGLFLALFLGDRSRIPAQTALAFRNTGTLHLLALSGLHVGVLFGVLGLGLRLVPGQVPRFAILGAFTLVSLWFAGPVPSLFRAGLAAVLFSGFRLADRSAAAMDVLALTLMLHLAADPESGRAVSFSLSYLSLAGLVLGLSLAGPLLRRWGAAGIAVAAAVGAQSAALPVSLAAFGVFHPIALVASLAGTPLVACFLVLGLAGVAVSGLPVTILHHALRAVLHGIVGLLDRGGGWLSAAPAVRWHWSWGLVVSMGLLAALAWARRYVRER